MLAYWQSVLACPLDQAALTITEQGDTVCPACGFQPIWTPVKDRRILDFRALNHPPRTVTLAFTIPTTPLDRYALVETHFRAARAHFEHHSTRQFRRKFGSKGDKGVQFYCQQVFGDYGAEAPVLDLGCGAGGMRRYLETIGFKNILSVDWFAAGADLLADAHSLPLAAESFQMVVSTQVFEHLYNPFLAMSEVGRILKRGGCFVGNASFWEAWHGSSYFHFTPDGWNALFRHANMTLEDLNPSWGIIPAALFHVLTPGFFRRIGDGLQALVEFVYRLFMGEAGVRRLQLRASASYQVYGVKRPPE